MSFLPSRVIVGADHAGYELKQVLVPLLKGRGFEVEDLSPTVEPGDDYPVIAHRVAEQVAASQGQMWGALLCGSGIGVSIEANRHPGVRAALIRTPEDARGARLDDHANILELGGRVTQPNELPAILDAWINTEPSSDPRHLRRVAEIDHPST